MKRFNWLAHMILSMGYHRGVEIGTGKGNTAKYLLSVCPNLHLVEVAFYPHADKKIIPKGVPANETSASKDLWRKRISRFKDRVTILEMPSVEAAEAFDEQVDFVFIDADHEYESVVQDIGLWAPKVRECGLVSGHDFGHPRFPGVEQAVRDYFGEDFHFRNDADWIWWHLKPRG